MLPPKRSACDFVPSAKLYSLPFLAVAFLPALLSLAWAKPLFVAAVSHQNQSSRVLLAAQSAAAVPSSSVEPAKSGDLLALFKAADAGNARLVKSLLDVGVDVEATDPDGWAALMFASVKGHQAVIDLLLEAGAKTEAKARDGSTPLIIASLHGRPRIVNALVEAGADVNSANQDGLTPLAAALFGKRAAEAKALVIAGADVNVKLNDGTSALTVAVLSGQKDTAELLLDAGLTSIVRRKVMTSGFGPARTMNSAGVWWIGILIEIPLR